jgi:hypothetical protein
MKRVLIMTLLGLVGCTGPAYQRSAVAPISAAELDRACITAAGDRLVNLLGREASRGRIVPISADMVGGSRYIIDERMVELDSMSVGVPTTYVFYCARTTGGSIIAKSVGRKV